MKQKTIIIGGGLAGSFMAARLCLAGQQLTLIDDPQPNSASHVAAGLFNVITGRYGAKSWMADMLLQEIQDFFAIPAFQPLQRFVQYTPIYRAFKEEAEYNKWLGRSADPTFRHLVEFQEQPLYPEQVINPHGGIMILPCGWVDVSALLGELHQTLVGKWGMKLQHEFVPFSQIDLATQQISLSQSSHSFDQLIIASGPQMATCPWLPEGSIIPNKGEILILEASNLNLPFVLSKKVYFIPLGGGRFLSGSTYANQFPHADPTPEGKAEILEYVHKAIHQKVRVIDHWAGIRPTTRNRRPIVGTHPQYSNLHFLGGFGTKGVLLAPYTSRLLTDKILRGDPEIPKEANLLRLF